MSDEKDVSGVVNAVFWNEGDDNKPVKVYLKDEEKPYSTFDTETVSAIEEGRAVAFDVEENNGYQNIVDDSVEIREQDGARSTETESDTGSGDAAAFTPTDARIMSQSLIRSAVLFHQNREDSTAEDVVETAEKFADAQNDLFQQLSAEGGQ